MKTELIEIFQTLRAQIQPYAVEGFKNKTNSETAYHLCSDTKDSVTEVNPNEIYFFGIEIKADYVGLYFRPIYKHEELRSIFSADLLQLLKDNDCFHITKLNELLLEQISTALKAGFKYYKQKGWV